MHQLWDKLYEIRILTGDLSYVTTPQAVKNFQKIKCTHHICWTSLWVFKILKNRSKIWGNWKFVNHIPNSHTKILRYTHLICSNLLLFITLKHARKQIFKIIATILIGNWKKNKFNFFSYIGQFPMNSISSKLLIWQCNILINTIVQLQEKWWAST